MRAHTPDDLPGRCRRCWLREAFCVCGDLPAVRPEVGALVVRHMHEARKSTNTARIAALALGPHAIEHVFTDDPPASNASLPDVTGAWLVYPDDDGPQVTADTPPPSRLVFIDGTWRQSRKMVKKLSRLHGLPRLCLPPLKERALSLRTTPLEGGRSTLQAIADAYASIGEVAVGQALSELSTLYVERVFRARGVWDQKREQFACAQEP